MITKLTEMSGDGRLAAPLSLAGEGSRILRAGFIPLVDASVLIAACEFGFAQKEGLTLDLVKDVSWANVRDRLAFRQFDIAHMLSPMPVASMLGLGSNPSPTITPFSLGRGGNAITLSTRLYSRMREAAALPETASALENARALAKVIEGSKGRGEPLPTLGVTYPFSSHNYEFRYWLAAGGIDPDRDVKLVVVPPPMTSDALAAGAIDGFCVGAPWNMVASERGVGRIVAAKQDIWPSAPEKVIGMRPDWAETPFRNRLPVDRCARCRSALVRPCGQSRRAGASAGRWPLSRRPRRYHSPRSGRRIQPRRIRGNRRVIDDYFTFHAGFANYPRPSQALWIYSQMIRWGQTTLSATAMEAAASAYRPDIYRTALGSAAPPADQDIRIEGTAADDRFLDGQVFDPHRIADYVGRFTVRSDMRSGSAIEEI